MREVTIHKFGFLWFMKVRLQVLSVEHGAVTAVKFTEFRSAIMCNRICKNIS